MRNEYKIFLGKLTVRWRFESPTTIILKWIINQQGNMLLMAFLITLYGWLLWTRYWMLGFQNDSGFLDQVRDYNPTVHSVGWNVLCTYYIVEYMQCYIDYILNFCIWMDVECFWSSRWVRAFLLYDMEGGHSSSFALSNTTQGRSPRAECR